MKISEKLKDLAPDLTREQPRPAQEELGGEPYAARTLDKCRATLAGTEGEYQFGCPMDQHFFADTGIDADAFKDFVTTGATDAEVGEWIRQHAKTTKR